MTCLPLAVRAVSTPRQPGEFFRAPTRSPIAARPAGFFSCWAAPGSARQATNTATIAMLQRMRLSPWEEVRTLFELGTEAQFFRHLVFVILSSFVLRHSSL